MAAGPTDHPAGTDVSEREELIQQRLRGAAAPSRVVVPRAPRDQPSPLSAGQQQMWVLHQLAPTSHAYLMSWLLRLSGPLDHEAMRWAWEQVIARHEVLRTRYARTGDEPVQLIDPPGRFALWTLDLTTEPADGREDRAHQLAEQERRRPFDLSTEQPVRITLIRLDPQLHLLVIVIHHIACDGASYRLLAAELSALYQQHLTGVPAGLPEVPLHYLDYAVWERSRRDSGDLHGQLRYWRQRLAGLQELALPFDGARPAKPDWRGAAVDVPVATQTAERIRTLAAAHRASPTIVLLAVYQAMLADLAGTPDVAVGIPVTARTLPELENLVGYTVNSIVVRSYCDPDRPFTDLLAEVKTHLLDAFDRRDTPFPWLVEQLRPARGGSSNPLFQVAFDMNPTEGGVFSLPGVTVTHVRNRPSAVAKFDLTLHVEEAPTRQLYAQLEFATALFREETVQGFADYYTRLLAAVLRDPQLPLARLRESSRLPAAAAPATAADGATGGTEPTGTTGATGTADDALVGRLLPAFRDALGVEQVEVWDNFFDLGGDSLRAVALAGRLRASGLDVSAADIFAHQTIAELAAAVSGRMRPEDAWTGTPRFALLDPADRAALPSGVVDAYPLGTAQLGMIVEMRARPDLSRYQDTTSFLIRDDGDFSLDALQAAAQQVVDRHEVLRTSFALTGYSVPLQLVHERASITVGKTDHGDLDAEGWEPRLRAYAAQRRRSPQDLAQAPLIALHAHVASGTTDWWLSVTECHLILEGWSFHTLLMEVLSGYREIRAGRRPVADAAPSFRFVDHIAAEAAAVQSADDRAYWRGVVAGRVPATLPSAWQGDRDLPEERYQYLVPLLDLEDGLRRLASQTRTSMKAVLLAAHLKVMSSLVATEDFFTGLVCDARPEVEGAERVPGMYLNTLPFAPPTGAATWRELVTAVFAELTTMWPHRRFPMQAIQQESGDGDRLLEVMFNYLDFHQVDKELIDWPATVDETDNEFALHVFTISGVLKFNTTTHALSREAAVRLGAGYRAVLEQMVREPDGDATGACLPAGEAEQLLAAGEGPDRYGEPATVPAAFAGWVQERPEALAVRCGAESLTYGQLDTAAERLADRLRQRGVGTDGVVAVVPTRDVWTPAVLLAVWKAGAAWLPLHPQTPAERVRELATGGGLTAVITPSGAVGDGTSLDDLPVIAMSGLDRPGTAGAGAGAGATAAAGGAPPALPAAGDIALVLPTRDTGDPPGAAISHRALAHALARLRGGLAERQAPTGAGSAWLYASAATSWAALSELFAPLTTGGQLIVSSLAPPEGARQLRELVATGEVTHLQATPLVAEELLPQRPPAPGTAAIVGGDPRTPAPAGVADWCFPAEGFAEAAGWVTLAGRPLPGTSVRVLDTELRPVPAGVRGELYLGGPGLADGFHGDPARTADCFVPDPFGPAGARLLRTGHLARFGPDGRLEQLGPVAEQLSSRGQALDLSQARAALQRQPAVRDGYLLLRPGADGAQLTGYVRAVTDAGFDPVESRRALADRLPRRLVPEALVAVSHWPLTRHGEIDVEALPAPSTQPEPSPAAAWDPEFEQLLRQVLPFLSAADELRPDLELASAGLDSLATVELLAALEQTYEIVIPDELLVLDMFATPGTLWQEISKLRDAAEPDHTG